jgi:hypothetical protein
VIFGGYNEQTYVTTPTMWRVWQRGTIRTGGNVTASGTMYYDNYPRESYHYVSSGYVTAPVALTEEHSRLHRRYGEKVKEFLDRLAQRRVFNYWGVPLRYLFEHAAWEPPPPSHHIVTMRTRGRTRGPRRGRIVRSYFRRKHRTKGLR